MDIDKNAEIEKLSHMADEAAPGKCRVVRPRPVSNQRVEVIGCFLYVWAYDIYIESDVVACIYRSDETTRKKAIALDENTPDNDTCMLYLAEELYRHILFEFGFKDREIGANEG